MAMNVRYSCDCGYACELQLGGGLLSNRLEFIRPNFSGAELKPFEEALSRSKADRYSWENELCLCPVCRELLAVPVLRYQEDGRNNMIRRACPVCGGAVQALNEPVACPKCGKPMEIRPD